MRRRRRKKKTRGGRGIHDLTAHHNEYINASFRALGISPELGHYPGGGVSLFFPIEEQQ